MLPPERIELPDGAYLRPFRVDDAEPLAKAVGDSLEHLRPWMPWANAEAADPAFQRERLIRLQDQWQRGEEYQYGLFEPDDPRVLGSFGLMTRRGPGTLEIGYWMHVDASGKGHASRAVTSLTDVALRVPRVKKVLIYCDEANLRSSAIPRRLGYRLLRIEETQASAPSETGRQEVWVREL
jgi:RimJ/RimL family protein N-acetyltransferase